MDQSKKTMRHFYCRDVLWETFEQMANDFDCSIDYLVNEAMRYYARSKNYQSPGAPNVTGGNPVPPNTGGPTAYPKASGASGAGARQQPSTQPPPQPNASVSNGPAAQPRRQAPPTPGYTPNNPPSARSNGPSSNHAPTAPPPAASNPMPQMGSAGPTLFIDYKGMRIDNKRIDEADVFHLCDYELRFTYRAD